MSDTNNGRGYGTYEDLESLRYELETWGGGPKYVADVPDEQMPIYSAGYRAGLRRAVAVLERKSHAQKTQ